MGRTGLHRAIDSIRNALYRFRVLHLLPIKRTLFIATSRGKVKTVCFIVSNLPMWRGQDLFDLLKNDNHFRPLILLCPFESYSSEEQIRNLTELRQFFSKRNIDYVDMTQVNTPGAYLRNTIRPDILFYQQPYYALYGNGIDSEYFKDKLICYFPYGICTISSKWLFNQKLSNFAWRLYYSSPAELSAAKTYADNKGRNVRVVGNTMAGRFLSGEQKRVWKPQEKKKRRIIWAPHYSIEAGFFHRGSFLTLNETMLRIASEYEDVIQFAFKPHPKLISLLYDHPEWGKERTDSYYQRWADGANTQLETGEYFDLFIGSDAMIHDCVSFTAEYLYVQKPSLFITEDKDKTAKELNELGEAALNAHYFAHDEDGVICFIKDVILQGNDPLLSARKDVYSKYLLPPGGKSASENIYEDLVKSLRLN